MRKLNDICNVITCGVAKRPEYYDDGIPFLSSKNVKSDRFLLNDYKYVSKEDFLSLTKNNKPEKGDILYTRVGSFGEAAVIDFDFDFAIFVSLTLIKPKNDIVLSRYLMHYLNSPKIKHLAKNSTSGVGVQNLNVKVVREFPIQLPPLDQQKKIAATLDAADAYRQKTKALIEKYDELLNSIVYQCLGDSLNKDLKNIKSGSKEFLEDGYSWYSLDEITELIADIDHKMPKSVEKGKIFLSAKDLSDNGELDFSNPKFISEEDFKHLSRKVKPKKLDIIYSRIGAKLGKARLVKTDHDFIVSYSCCTVRPKQDIVAPLYLKYILDSEATLRQASHGTRGIGVPDLGMGEIRTFKIPVPEKSISKKIVNQLERIEAQKAQAQASLAQAEDLFNSLLQRAFKGELS